MASAQGAELSCWQNKLFFAKHNFSTDINVLDISADNSQLVNNIYKLSGNASIKSNKYHLSADKIDIDRINKTSIASGNVEFQDDDLMLISENAVTKLQKKGIYISLKKARFYYPKLNIQGSAYKITSNEKKQVFDHVNYSLCPADKFIWNIKADKVTLNLKTNKGIVKGATMYLLGVPIFYLPYYNWVLKGRASGFLPFKFGSYSEPYTNENNYQLELPYYFNIAPDSDLVLTFGRLSSRGNIIKANYRRLIEGDNLAQGNFKVNAHYLDNDSITNNTRWLVASKLNLALNPKTEFEVVINKVSDADYFKEIAHENTTNLQLDSYARLNYDNSEKGLHVSFFGESEQLINNGSATYTRSPEIIVTKNVKLNDANNIKFSVAGVKFTHKNLTNNLTGKRLHVETVFSKSIAKDNYLFMPNLSLLNTNYSIDNGAIQSRNMFSIKLDGKLFLQKDALFFNTILTHKLTPRIVYNYRPKKQQRAIPNFDSYLRSNAYEGLFSGRKFTGVDKISNANSVTLGAQYSFIDKKTGALYSELKVAQTLHISDQSINLGGALVKQRKYSNIALEGDLNLGNFTFDTKLQYDPETNKINKANNSISYYDNNKKFITLAYNDNGDIKSQELYGAYPINDELHVFSGINRSITDSIINKQEIALVYESCCLVLRLGYLKERVSDDNDDNYDKSIKFELIFTGLTSDFTSNYEHLIHTINY